MCVRKMHFWFSELYLIPMSCSEPTVIITFVYNCAPADCRQMTLSGLRPLISL